MLFLLRLPDEQPSGRKPHHRLGGGKPLGFGSVRLEIQSLDLQDGAALRRVWDFDLGDGRGWQPANSVGYRGQHGADPGVQGRSRQLLRPARPPAAIGSRSGLGVRQGFLYRLVSTRGLGFRRWSSDPLPALDKQAKSEIMFPRKATGMSGSTTTLARLHQSTSPI